MNLLKFLIIIEIQEVFIPQNLVGFFIFMRDNTQILT